LKNWQPDKTVGLDTIAQIPLLQIVVDLLSNLLYNKLDPSAAGWRRRRQPESSGAAAAEKQTARRRASRNYQPSPPPKFSRRAGLWSLNLSMLMHCEEQHCNS